MMRLFLPMVRPVAVVLCLCGAGLWASCTKEVNNPPPDSQHGTITTLLIVLSDSSAFPARHDTVAFDDPDGAGGQQPLQWDTLRLKTNHSYHGRLVLQNRGSIPFQDLGPLIEVQGHQHLFCYLYPDSLLDIRITDRDHLMLPLGFRTEWTTGVRPGSGFLEIQLRHLAYGKNLSSNHLSGHSDLQVRFPLILQP